MMRNRLYDDGYLGAWATTVMIQPEKAATRVKQTVPGVGLKVLPKELGAKTAS